MVHWEQQAAQRTARVALVVWWKCNDGKSWKDLDYARHRPLGHVWAWLRELGPATRLSHVWRARCFRGSDVSVPQKFPSQSQASTAIRFSVYFWPRLLDLRRT
jgi:hypothetical protein